MLNQGIHRSLRNSLLIGFISGGTIGVIGLLSIGLKDVLSAQMSDILFNRLDLYSSTGIVYYTDTSLGDALSTHLSAALFLMISSGLLICIVSGGWVVIRHYVLRFLLWRSQTFPWDMRSFLDDATARILLRRLGGGYSFTHRLLLDHFADLPIGVLLTPTMMQTNIIPMLSPVQSQPRPSTQRYSPTDE